MLEHYICLTATSALYLLYLSDIAQNVCIFLQTTPHTIP